MKTRSVVRREVAGLLLANLVAMSARAEVVNVATVENGDMTVMQQLTGEFERGHPGTTVKWNFFDESTLRAKIGASVKTGRAEFDVVAIGTYEAPTWGKQGWLAPIAGLPATYDLDDIIKPIRTALSVGPTLYALPFYGESSITYYRKDLFEQHQLVMPERPTYDDIKRFAHAITDRKQGVFGICLRGKAGWGENMAFVGTMANAYGAQWFDMQWRPGLDSAAWKAALRDYAQLLTQEGPPKPTANGFSENLALFADGRCGMWIDATVAAGMLFNPQISKVADKVGLAAAPVSATTKGANWLWSWALAIPSTSKQKPAALQFISWATSKEYTVAVAGLMGWGSVPPGTRYSTYKDQRYRSVAPYAGAVLKMLEGADPSDATLSPSPYVGIQYVAIPSFAEFGNAVGANVAALVDGTVSIDDIGQLNQAQVVKSFRQADHQ